MDQWVVHDGNAFRNSEGISDVIFQSEVRLIYSASIHPGDPDPRSGGPLIRARDSGKSDDFRFAYDGSFFRFQEYSDRGFQLHELSANWSHTFREEGPVFTLMLNAEKRMDQDAYSLYDCLGGSGFAGLRFGMGGLGKWVLKGFGQVQKYTQLKEFDFEEYQATCQMNRTFQSRTTVIGQIQAGTKHYLEPVAVRTIEIIPIPWTIRGKKNAKWRKEQGDKTPWTAERVIRSEKPGKRLTQGVFSLRVAQAVSENTGLAVQGLIRRNSGGGGRYLSFLESGYGQDNPLFDDPYNFDSDESVLEITRKLGGSILCKAGWEGRRKRYTVPVYDTIGNPVEGTLRRDDRSMAWISFSMTFPLRFIRAGAGVSASYTWLSNRSNDGYFDYTGGMAGVGFNLSF